MMRRWITLALVVLLLSVSVARAAQPYTTYLPIIAAESSQSSTDTPTPEPRP